MTGAHLMPRFLTVPALRQLTTSRIMNIHSTTAEDTSRPGRLKVRNVMVAITVYTLQEITVPPPEKSATSVTKLSLEIRFMALPGAMELA